MKLGFVIPLVGSAVSSAAGLSAFCHGLEVWRCSGVRPRSFRKIRWLTTATTATLPEAVREKEEVVPVNVSTWVLPSGVTVGR